MDPYAKAIEASAKALEVIIKGLTTLGSWLARVNKAQNSTQSIQYVGFLETYLDKIKLFIQQTNLKRLEDKGMRIGYNPPKEFTKDLAKKYAEKATLLEALVNGVTRMLEMENNISWTVAKKEIIKLGRFLLGKHGLKFATKEIKDGSAYRFFEQYYEQSIASVSTETDEEKNQFAALDALHNELDDIGDSEEIQLSAEDLAFLTSLAE